MVCFQHRLPSASSLCTELKLPIGCWPETYRVCSFINIWEWRWRKENVSPILCLKTGTRRSLQGLTCAHRADQLWQPIEGKLNLRLRIALREHAQLMGVAGPQMLQRLKPFLTHLIPSASSEFFSWKTEISPLNFIQSAPALRWCMARASDTDGTKLTLWSPRFMATIATHLMFCCTKHTSYYRE